MGNKSKGLFLEVAGQGEFLFDYFNSARLPPSVRSLKDNFVPIMKDLYINRKRTTHL